MCECVNIHELSRSFHGVFTASHFLVFFETFFKTILGMSFWDFVWKNWIMFCKTHLGDVILGFCLEEVDPVLQINILGMSSWDFVWKNWILFCKQNLGDVILGVCLEEVDPVLRKNILGDVILGVCLEEVDPVLRKNILGVSSWDFVWKKSILF